MSKYIDADKLIDEIDSRIERIQEDEKDGYPDTTSSDATLESFRRFITSLQQEQPEVDLEKEFEDYLDNVEGQPRMWHPDEQIEWAKDIARHFYELGLNARKEE